MSILLRRGLDGHVPDVSFRTADSLCWLECLESFAV